MAVVVVAPFSPRGPHYSVSSTTPYAAAGGGLFAFAISDTDLAYSAGTRLRATSRSSGEWIEGEVLSYSGTEIIIEADASSRGPGVWADWNLTLAGEPATVIPAASTATNAVLTESHASNAVTFEIKTLAGLDPSIRDAIKVAFPSATNRALSAPLSLVIPQAVTLGTANSTPFRLWFVLFDRLSTLVLGVIQTRSSTNTITALPPSGIIPTAMFGSGAGQVYATEAVGAPVSYVVIGCAEYDGGLAVAGDWSGSPTRIVMYGPGIALPGATIQQRGNATGSVGTGGTAMPHDDTIPQITEGDQYLAQGITPRASMSVLEVSAQVMLSPGSARTISAALFKTGVSNALAVTWTHEFRHTVQLMVRTFSGDVSAQTFTARMGPSGGGSFSMNGEGGTQYFGGSSNTFIRVREIQT